MKRRAVLITALTALFLVALVGCFEAPTGPVHNNPLDPDNPDTDSPEPPKPRGLSAVIGDRLVSLSWTLSDTTGIGEYKVYRWEVEVGEEEEFEEIETTETTSCVDVGVRNGQEYAYKVSAVNRLGLEGELSNDLRVTPRLFSVAIEHGKPKTRFRDVTLTLSASSRTERMQISNSPDLTGAAWEIYQTSFSWRLEAGDGSKTVYARYRDADDGESEIVSDSIVLDTRAVIESLTEDTDGQDMSVGETIHFRLVAGEPFGVASVDIGNVVADIGLFDDGTSGDQIAEDGVYERDYVIENWVEAIDAPVTGHFSDEIGNEAEPLIAPGSVTIIDPPAPVEMRVPVVISERRIALSWTRSNEDDFARYKFYRSYVPGVDTSTERELLAEITNPAETDFVDHGLEPDSTYYYAVYVVDDVGLSAVSNEVTATTAANEPPEAVELFTPWAPADTDSQSLELSWEQSDAPDFMSYELFGWEEHPPDPPDTGQKRLLARRESPGETFYTHSNLSEGVVYWYEVAVVDSFGARAISNSVSGTP